MQRLESYNLKSVNECDINIPASALKERQFKGGYLDCSHLIELKYISLKFIWKNNTNHQKLRIIKLQNKKIVFDGLPLKGYVAS